MRDELAERLAAIPDEDGEPIATRVYRPEELYDEVNGVAPDLHRPLRRPARGAPSAPSAATDGIHTFENDTGPDDANHAQDGLLIMAGPGSSPARREGMHLLDVAPTVLDLLGIDAPDGDARP